MVKFLLLLVHYPGLLVKLNYFKDYKIIFTYVYVSMWFHVWEGACRSQERVPDTLELESQVIVKPNRRPWELTAERSKCSWLLSHLLVPIFILTFSVKIPGPWGDYDAFTIYMCDAPQTLKALLKVMTETKHLRFSSGLHINKNMFLTFTHEPQQYRT